MAGSRARASRSAGGSGGTRFALDLVTVAVSGHAMERTLAPAVRVPCPLRAEPLLPAGAVAALFAAGLQRRAGGLKKRSAARSRSSSPRPETEDRVLSACQGNYLVQTGHAGNRSGLARNLYRRDRAPTAAILTMPSSGASACTSEAVVRRDGSLRSTGVSHLAMRSPKRSASSMVRAATLSRTD